MLKFKAILLLMMAMNSVTTADFGGGLQPIFNFIADFLGPKVLTPEELGLSRGQCAYNFLDYIGDSQECTPDDRFILHLLPQRPSDSNRKPPIMVKCLETEPTDNITGNNELIMLKSVKEIVALLKPIGNATKRHEPGSCVLVLFYTESCESCAHVAPYANRLPRFFPTLRIAAVDAFELPSFNTEVGIVGLPTMLLFHQGRPIVKYYSEARSFLTFIRRHTGIKAIAPAAGMVVYGPLPETPRPQNDYILLLAWTFILACLGNYFSKSRLCLQIVEMIKRNWRESEAQLEHN